MRQDVAGQRVVEVRAWELAWGRAKDTVASGNEDDLVGWLVAELGPTIEVVNEISRRPRSALWRGASDRLAQALVLAGEELGNRALGEAAARRALAVPGPLGGRLRIEELVVGGEREVLLLRNGCCLWHRIPGEEKCSTCPLLESDARAPRVLAEQEVSG
jgi:FhuF 2Fe-2S C-terminal domain